MLLFQCHPLPVKWANEEMRRILEDCEGKIDLLVEIVIFSMNLHSLSSDGSVLTCLPEKAMAKHTGTL
jgi:hypothetical protein